MCGFDERQEHQEGCAIFGDYTLSDKDAQPALRTRPRFAPILGRSAPGKHRLRRRS